MAVTRIVAASVVALIGGCGDNTLRLDGEHYQYVVSEIRVPINNATARDNGLDLNNDKTVDNQLGMVFGSLASFGLGVADTASEALQRGGLVMLADLQTTSFDDTELSGLTTYLGDTISPAPCLDPARLDTCGLHLRGTGEFSVEEGSASDQALGPIDGRVFAASIGTLPVEIAIDASSPIRLDLRGARVRLSQISEGGASGILSGGITRADIQGVVVTQAAAQMDRIVRAECGQSGGSTCGCIEGSRADLLQDEFDRNDDCAIELAEVSTHGIVDALLAPDIRINGEDLLSFGVGIELTRATF